MALSYPIDKLKRVVDAAYRDLAVHRENRIRLIEKYAGFRYLDNSRARRRFEPFNFLQVAVSTYARSLYSRNPKILVNSYAPMMRPLAFKFEMAMNHFMRVIEFKQQMDMCVRNALFGMGIMKVGLMNVNAPPLDGPTLPSAQPYAMSVDMDDFVYDTTASNWNDILFCGNRQRVPLSWALNNPAFDERARKQLQPIHMSRANADGSARAEEISKGNAQNNDMIEDMTEIWDIWCPKQGVLVSVPAQQGSADVALMEVQWDGPRHGPYSILSYQDVPNNLQPVGPASHWESTHDVLNSLVSKLNNQAKRSKHIQGVQMGGGRDAKNIQGCEDGGIVTLSNPKNVQEIRIDGPDNPTLLYFLKMKEIGSWLAGNLETLAGLSAQAQTLGQEQLLAQATNRTMQELSDRTTAFTKRVITDVGEWMWNDPNITFPLSYEVAGHRVSDNFNPMERMRGSYNDFNLEIDAYSMQEDSPALKIQQLKDFMGAFGPVMPVLQQQGKSIDLGELVRQWGRYVNFAEIDKLLIYSDPNQQAMQQSRQPVSSDDQPIAKWPKEPRVELRKTVGTRTEGGSTDGAIFNSASKPRQPAGVA